MNTVTYARARPLLLCVCGGEGLWYRSLTSVPSLVSPMHCIWFSFFWHLVFLTRKYVSVCACVCMCVFVCAGDCRALG